MSFDIEGHRVLRNLSADIAVRRLGIVGRNGSGKSTLARLLAGLVAPSGGQMTLNGIDPARDRRAALQEVGILFQNPDHQIIFPTVLEEIAFGLVQTGLTQAQAEDRARATLESFDKAHWQDAYVTRLSQGQKHLLCLMAVMAMAPRVLILDEPFAGLDIPTRAQLQRYLGLYQGQLIHITHDPGDLADYDHVLWLEQGGIHQSGAAAKVLAEYLRAMHDQGEADDIADLAG